MKRSLVVVLIFVVFLISLGLALGLSSCYGVLHLVVVIIRSIMNRGRLWPKRMLSSSLGSLIGGEWIFNPLLIIII